MNRRQKKKQKVDYVELLVSKCRTIDLTQVKNKLKTAWLSFPVLHRKLLVVLIPIIVVLMLLPTPEFSPETDKSGVRVELDINPVALSEQKSADQAALKSKHWSEYIVNEGDTLAQVFRNNKLALSDLNALVKVEGKGKPLSQIRKGQLVRFKVKDDGQLDILQLEKNGSSVMFFRLSDGGFGRSK